MVNGGYGGSVFPKVQFSILSKPCTITHVSLLRTRGESGSSELAPRTDLRLEVYAGPSPPDLPVLPCTPWGVCVPLQCLPQATWAITRQQDCGHIL